MPVFGEPRVTTVMLVVELNHTPVFAESARISAMPVIKIEGKDNQIQPQAPSLNETVNKTPNSILCSNKNLSYTFLISMSL